MSDPITTIPGAISANEASRIMLLLVGKPFTGKTWAAATFPNALFLDYDHKAKADTTIVPFWSGEFCDKYAPRYNANAPPNQRDAILYYLGRHLGRDIPPQTTLIVDTGTAVEAAFHHQTSKVEQVPMGKGGKKDGFHVWNAKMEYFPALFVLLKTHPGHVIYIMHEQAEKNEEGLATGKIKPLMNGSFVDQIANHFTAMFHQRITHNALGKPEYIWEVMPTRAFESNATFAHKFSEATMKAEYASLEKYFPDYPR